MAVDEKPYSQQEGREALANMGFACQIIDDSSMPGKTITVCSQGERRILLRDDSVKVDLPGIVLVLTNPKFVDQHRLSPAPPSGSGQPPLQVFFVTGWRDWVAIQ